MGLMGRLVLAANLIVTLSLGTAASAATIDAFSGHWVGKGITENAANASGVRFTDRDLDVTIKPSENGFTIVWKTTRTTQRNGVDEVGLWSVAIAFVATGNDGIYRMDGAGDPVSGAPYMWARIDDSRLVVNTITISKQGVLEHQRYDRTLLTDDEMRLRYTRSLDGSVVRSVRAFLARE